MGKNGLSLKARILEFINSVAKANGADVVETRNLITLGIRTTKVRLMVLGIRPEMKESWMIFVTSFPTICQ